MTKASRVFDLPVKNNIIHITLNNEHLKGNDFVSADASTEISALRPSASLGRASPSVAVEGNVRGSEHEIIQEHEISYARLSLHRNHSQRGQKVNLDFRLGASTRFNQLIFHHTPRACEFTQNLPQDWQCWHSYHGAWQEYHRLAAVTDQIWIAKGIAREGTIKGRIKPGTAMVVYPVDGVMQGQCWIHHEHFEFVFDQEPKNSRYFLADCEPIRRRVEEWGDNTWV